MWCACNGPFAESDVVAKIVAVASEGVEIGVVEEVSHDRKEIEKRGGVDDRVRPNLHELTPGRKWCRREGMWRRVVCR